MKDPSGDLSPVPAPSPALFGDVLEAYRDFLLHQGAAASALVRWTRTSRSFDFAWLGGVFEREELALRGEQLIIPRGNPLFDSVKRMHTTVTLNPYEREILYGYPFVIGRRDGRSIRGPLLTVPVNVVVQGDGFAIAGADEAMRFNALPFKAERREILDVVLARLADLSPPWPADEDAIGRFLENLAREVSGVEVSGVFDGTLGTPPSEPSSGEFLRVIPQAAVFVSPRSNYFLASDLKAMQESAPQTSDSLTTFFLGAGRELSVEIGNDQLDAAPLAFPFPSNRSQRRIALLLQDPTTSVVRVEGPPGTGKSLTIANLACHLASTGKSVLVTSQKDKALQVVDEKLRELDVPGFPITLLRHDKDAKRELLARLEDAGRKKRGSVEVREELEELRSTLELLSNDYVSDAVLFDEAVVWEERVEAAARGVQGVGGIRGILGRRRFRKVIRQADRAAPVASDELAARALGARADLTEVGQAALRTRSELAVAEAPRGDRQHLKELEQLLRRDQRSARNYHLFDRMKQDPARAKMLLGLLPVWIMAPDDVARLFPSESGLFDVVIVDEASQVDLPSIFPVLHRAKKLVVSGDTKQMQPQRFAFVAQSIATQAWQRVRGHADPVVDLLDPVGTSLLQLAFVRAQEENLLDEHFRSLPSIIDFSNNRWYRGRLRVMTDERRKRFGSPSQPLMQLHHVAEGRVSIGTQENLEEAKALVALLERLLRDPDYAAASIGVLCLFSDQVELVQEVVVDSIDESAWVEHDLVVVNPDGFQGDERDVILYSLSYDADVMPQAAIGARQQESAQVQGMLNVAFTRARDEVHVFHSASVDTFFKEDGSGAIGDWLAHIQRVQERPRVQARSSRLGRVDSQFEADVAEDLLKRGVDVTHQYSACGYFIDMVCELEGLRVAVECDGPTHFDEHGRRRVEDLERLSVLRRAGWIVVNIPYRKWHRNPGGEIERVLSALQGEPVGEEKPEGTGRGSEATTRHVSTGQDAIFRAVKAGATAEEDVFRAARDMLGRKRLTLNLRMQLQHEAGELNHTGLVVREEGEYFLTPEGRQTITIAATPTPNATRTPKPRRAEKRTKRSRSAPRARTSPGSCSCGGKWVVRAGRYGTFYGCSRYPKCRRTKNYP